MRSRKLNVARAAAAPLVLLAALSARTAEGIAPTTSVESLKAGVAAVKEFGGYGWETP